MRKEVGGGRLFYEKSYISVHQIHGMVLFCFQKGDSLFQNAQYYYMELMTGFQPVFFINTSFPVGFGIVA